MTDPDQPETLQDLVLTRLAELGAAGEPVSSRQAVRGLEHLISYETLRTIARGVHGGRITDPVAEGLSRALKVPIERVYRAAGVPRPADRWEFPAQLSRLDGSQRKLVEDVARALLDAFEKGRRSASGE